VYVLPDKLLQTTNMERWLSSEESEVTFRERGRRSRSPSLQSGRESSSTQVLSRRVARGVGYDDNDPGSAQRLVDKMIRAIWRTMCCIEERKMIQSYLVCVIYVESFKMKKKTMDSQPVIYVDFSKASAIIRSVSQVHVVVRPTCCRC